MKINEDSVLHVAGLARVELSADEVRKFRKDLSSILEYMDMLSEAGTDDAVPMYHPIQNVNVMRPDEARPSQDINDALVNAPLHEDGYVVVPRVID